MHARVLDQDPDIGSDFSTVRLDGELTVSCGLPAVIGGLDNDPRERGLLII